jgi:hypothetical protein
MALQRTRVQMYNSNSVWPLAASVASPSWMGSTDLKAALEKLHDNNTDGIA